ncbi:hypothetical protein BC828DRAFT_383856 [Blastocladiella britannica]|nr:hypothetical protein BC828DRAFT_383856 [Blastocladiella britannica]
MRLAHLMWCFVVQPAVPNCRVTTATTPISRSNLRGFGLPARATENESTDNDSGFCRCVALVFQAHNTRVLRQAEVGCLPFLFLAKLLAIKPPTG